MNISFENKVARDRSIVGQVLATARAFAEADAAVVLADVREDLVKAEAEKLAGRLHHWARDGD
jgi:NAD(P)-dependent dehydrogenase (short-subunit alcohol dehydrogenase family)